MHKIIHLSSVDSTNEYLKRISASAQSGLTVWADEQTMGKGRLNRHWVSEKGDGAWFSLIVKDSRLTPETATSLVFVCALAAAQSLMSLSANHDICIKWPNDLVLHGKKLVGILCESGFDGEKLSYIICGIGINLNAKHFPSELPWATSLYLETGKRLEAETVIEAFLKEFDALLEMLLTKGLNSILERIKPLSATIGRTVCAVKGEEKLVGQAVDFDERGALVIENEDGRHFIEVGDVSVRGVMGYTG